MDILINLYIFIYLIQYNINVFYILYLISLSSQAYSNIKIYSEIKFIMLILHLWI